MGSIPGTQWLAALPAPIGTEVTQAWVSRSLMDMEIGSKPMHCRGTYDMIEEGKQGLCQMPGVISKKTYVNNTTPPHTKFICSFTG